MPIFFSDPVFETFERSRPRIISVNVGPVGQLGRVRGKPVYSGFIKKPVSGAVKVGMLNFEGDRQADLTVHGDEDKAVYADPSEHYHTGPRNIRIWKGLIDETVDAHGRGALGSPMTFCS
jgi:hypothetical protein